MDVLAALEDFFALFVAVVAAMTGIFVEGETHEEFKQPEKPGTYLGSICDTNETKRPDTSKPIITIDGKDVYVREFQTF